MSDTTEHHDHHEDNSVNVKVAWFFVAVLVAITIISWLQ